ncbi:UDP-GlcNAc:betaGal beta-1,3-N-acetylglucosaminyltransferase-like protein 1 [Cylas formicarius]|uniref:UDP-GlcNAc:betaGal beta-1,3-N-acetylglucosaminyltransferase-like protein 1 n=1 Tax=Cylas formicarius TaxID=197179 RepID=UPI0029587A3E|nr:UDP-GlcNAc:betaGal beta-1,3-N-acetylglucosaminyltransferase-like protein 1 [Cylas formicarius]
MDEGNHMTSIIIPVYNGAPWINRCFQSILKQSAISILNIEICVCDDGSTDDTSRLLLEWRNIFSSHDVRLNVIRNQSGEPKGVGFAKNQAISLSRGSYLCFQDIDDVMLPNRILKQFEVALKSPNNVIVGCQFKREPDNSTIRYTKWANSLTQEQLNLQVFTSHGPTVIMPTWFCHKDVFVRVGGFFESKKGTPEDLVFFNKHLDLGGKIIRVDDILLIYTFHPNQTTFSIAEDTIWSLRLERLERVHLANWTKFTIWNAGKQGRKFYNSLSLENRDKVLAFCDVDLNKIGKRYASYDAVQRKMGKEVDIIHFKDAVPPFVICMKIDLTEGVFEKNLKTLNLKEGVDYVMFS